MKTRWQAIKFQGMRILGKGLLWVLLTLLPVASHASVSGRADPKRVLIFQSQQEGAPAAMLIEQGIRSTGCYEMQISKNAHQRFQLKVDLCIPGVIAVPDYKGTLDLALTIQLGIRRVAILLGNGELERYYAYQARRVIHDFKNRPELIDLSGVPWQELLNWVANLPERTICLYLKIFQDDTDTISSPQEALSVISQASSSPIYSIFDDFLGYGTIGGSMLSFEEVGRKAAEIGMLILQGENLDNIPKIAEVTAAKIFDWRQLNRWGIIVDRLPPGSMVQYKQKSLWDLYKWQLIGLAFFCIIGTLMIVSLIKQRKRRGQTEKELYATEQRYLLALAESTDGLWDWDIRSNTVFFSDRFKKILGYSPGELPCSIDFFRSRLHPEDADAIWAAIQRHLQEHVPFNVEYRLETESGEYLWFLARAQAIWDTEGNATRMSGWIQDITARKQTELNLKTALSEIKELKGQLEAERAYLQDEIKLEYNHENIIGQSDAINCVLYKVEQIARNDTNVLVLGETGTGKELVARAIHSLSQRKDRALVKINCATLPSNLIESELFGHEKGAFTGAHSRQLGRFEVANGAILFLDEIGELPLELQPKLLRVIQDGEFERLGSSHTIKVDVRIIAATNRNLEEEVRRSRFREDLWFRLNIFPITMPPLRDRLEDIPLLVDFYVNKISKRLGKTIESIPTSVMDALQGYHWPGNIRELENVIERAVINSSGPKLHLVDELKKPHKDLTTTPKTMEAVEREHIVRVLEQTHWKVSGNDGAAEILGLNRSTLCARMRKLGIRKP